MNKKNQTHKPRIYTLLSIFKIRTLWNTNQNWMNEKGIAIFTPKKRLFFSHFFSPFLLLGKILTKKKKKSSSSNCSELKIKLVSSLYFIKRTLFYYFYLLKYFNVLHAEHQTLLDTVLPKRACDRSGIGDNNLAITHWFHISG